MADNLPAVAPDPVADEIASLQSEMGDSRGAYWSGPQSEGRQARYRELLEAREANAPAPARDMRAERRAELQALMADGLSDYWRGPRAAELQDEYRRIVGDGAPEDPAGVAASDGDVGTAVGFLNGTAAGKEWIAEAGGHLKGALETGEAVRRDILANIGATASDVEAAFDGLADNVRASVYGELATAYTPPQPPAAKDTLAAFAGTSAGRILAREWGDDAGRKLAGILHRWDRLTARLDDREFAELDDFYRNRLQPHERAAVLRRLAA